MMTLKQIKTCQRLGLDCDWIIQNYSLRDSLFGKLFKNKKVEQETKKEDKNNYNWEQVSKQYNTIIDTINKRLAIQYKTETSNNKAKVRAALQYNIKLYLSALVQEGLRTKNPYILWYGMWEDESQSGNGITIEEGYCITPITQQDYINIPNATISNIYSAGDLGWDVFLNCDYINKTGHYFSIECDKLCRPRRYNIEG